MGHQNNLVRTYDHPCDVVPRFPVPRFQSPRCGRIGGDVFLYFDFIFLHSFVLNPAYVLPCFNKRVYRWYVGDRAFPVAAARVWNSLSDLVTSAPSVAVFRSQLKTHLFNISYPSPL